MLGRKARTATKRGSCDDEFPPRVQRGQCVVRQLKESQVRPAADWPSVTTQKVIGTHCGGCLLPIDIKQRRMARCYVHMPSGAAKGDETFVPLDLLSRTRLVLDVPFLLRIEGSSPVSSKVVMDLFLSRLCPKRTSVVIYLLRKSGVSGIWCRDSALLYQQVR